MFTSFLVETAKAVTTIGARKEQLTDLIENANTTFQAIGSQQTDLAQGLKQLPVTLRQGNKHIRRTAVDVRRAGSKLVETLQADAPSR